VTAAGLAGAWTDLVATAMLGTDRRPLPPVPEGTVEAFGVGADAAVALLDRAAATVAARRAGAVPEPAGPRLRECPTDSRPPCPSRAARRLGLMLDGHHPDLLPEWLDALRAAGLAAPPEHLPALMDATRASPAARRSVHAVAGPLNAWLCDVVPGLGWEPPGAPAESWERGGAAERIDAIRRLRATDPAAARALLAGGSAGERAEVRAGCLAALAVGLGPDDETVLELALDDRVPAVRTVAADLLARLPDSAWAGRMARRVEQMVQVAGREGHDRFDIRLVAPVPARWERDGIDAAAPPGTSVGAHVLAQVVGGTPLSWWEGLGPAPHLVVLASEHELGPVLLAGWAAAAIRQRRADWARLLLDEIAEPALVAVLDREHLEPLARRAATADGVLTALGLAIWEALERPWPESIGPRVAEAVLAIFLDRRVGRHHGPSLRRLARALDPAVLVPLADALGGLDLPPPIDGLRDDLAERLRFRAAMLEELAPA
jgi:hypothetical protein